VDPDLGPLPGLNLLRTARALVNEEFEDILRSARALGWRPNQPSLQDIRRTEISSQGLTGMLQALVARIVAVEELLDRTVKPETEPARGRAAIQILLVQEFCNNLKVEFALAKLEARTKEIVDFSVLGRAIENIAELTADFIVTARGLAGKMTAALREASEQLRPKIHRIVSGFKTILLRVVSLLSRRERNKEDRPVETTDSPAADLLSPPPDFDIEKVRGLVLAGEAPPVAWRPWIHDLDFDGEDLLSLVPIADLGALKTLTLNSTPVSDLVPLARLTALERLDIRSTPVRELNPIADLVALTSVDIGNTDVTDLKPLAGLTKLLKLDIGGTKVINLMPLASLKSIQRLDLYATLIDDLAALSSLLSLQYLVLAETKINDLSPLSRLVAIQMLDLKGTRVRSLAPLVHMTALRTLDLRGTSVGNLEPLAHLRNLKRVFVERGAEKEALEEILVAGAQIIVAGTIEESRESDEGVKRQ